MREDIKKRREKYENVVTPAMKLFKGKELIVERKSGMNIVHYKYMRQIQARTLKKLFNGNLSRRISRLMIPSFPSLHLQMQVAKHRAIKNGWLEEVKYTEGTWSSNLITKLFTFFRKFMFNEKLSSSVS